MKAIIACALLFSASALWCAPNGTDQYSISVTSADSLSTWFAHDSRWRGFDQGSSVDLGNNRVLWIFSEGYISKDGSGSRSTATLIHNSIGVQSGYDIATAGITYSWGGSPTAPSDFFAVPQTQKLSVYTWYWAGPGILVNGKVTVFLIELKSAKKSSDPPIVVGQSAAVIWNPGDAPQHWTITYARLPAMAGMLITQLLTDGNYVYGIGKINFGKTLRRAYLVRWTMSNFAMGNFVPGNQVYPEWWYNGAWLYKSDTMRLPKALFDTGNWFGVSYYPGIAKFVEIECIGDYGKNLGIRMADNLSGPWSKIITFYAPHSPVSNPIFYNAMVHPEMAGTGLYVSYNIGSQTKGEVATNIYLHFPVLVIVNIAKKIEANYQHR